MSKVYRSSVFPSLLDEIMNTDWFGGLEHNNGYHPPVNIQENKKEFVLELIVPGRNKEDFIIEIDNGVLAISSTVEKPETKETDNYSVREFSSKSFKKTFKLPKTINEENIKVDYVNGILMFAMPKREETLPKPKRLLEIG